MRILKNNEIKILEWLVSLSQEELRKSMATYLKKYYSNIIITNDYIVAEGNIPIALAAHMDTVFADGERDVFYDPKHSVVWSPDGLGADDRAGIFAIISIIKDGFRPHIILTTDEESGCLGAEKLSKLPMPFKELKYIIELDRRGINDCVFYDCYNEKFIEYIESFGFVENWGTFSDISTICPAWDACGVNLSIGYFNEHSHVETLHIGYMFNTIEKVKKMLAVPTAEIPNFKYVRVAHSYLHYLDKMQNFIKEGVICACCGNFFDEYDTYPVMTKDGEKPYCITCLSDEKIEWCSVCGEPFIPNMEQTRCDHCVGGKKVV